MLPYHSVRLCGQIFNDRISNVQLCTIRLHHTQLQLNVGLSVYSTDLHRHQLGLTVPSAGVGNLRLA